LEGNEVGDAVMRTDGAKLEGGGKNAGTGTHKSQCRFGDSKKKGEGRGKGVKMNFKGNNGDWPNGEGR